MAISTYDEVIVALGNWLDRDDLTARAPEFIALAEAHMNRTLRVRQMETRSVSSVGTSGEFFDLPTDFLEEKSIRLSDGTDSWTLDPQPAELLEATTTRTGRPAHYALVGDAIYVSPAPDKTYTATMIYYARIPALGEDQQTNWLLTKAPDAYLYGALTHAAPYLEDDTGTGGNFAAFFGGALTSLKAEQTVKVGRLSLDYPATGGNFDIIRGTF